MYYLIPIPIVMVAVMVRLVSLRYKLNILAFISKIVIILGVLLFIYWFTDYNGFNIIEYVKSLFVM